MFGTYSDIYGRAAKPAGIIYDKYEYEMRGCRHENFYACTDTVVKNKDIYKCMDVETKKDIFNNKIKTLEKINDFDDAILKLSKSYITVNNFIRCKVSARDVKFLDSMLEKERYKRVKEDLDYTLLDFSQYMHELIMFFEGAFKINNDILKKEISDNKKIKYDVKDFSIFDNDFVAECKSFQEEFIEKFRNDINILSSLKQKAKTKTKETKEINEYVEDNLKVYILKLYIDSINNLSKYIKESYSYVLTNFAPKIKNDIDTLQSIFAGNVVNINRKDCMAALYNPEETSKIIFKNSIKKNNEGIILFEDFSAIYTKNGKDTLINGSSSTMKFLEEYVDDAIRATFSKGFMTSIEKFMKVSSNISIREKIIFFMIYAENANILNEDILIKCKNKAKDDDKLLSFYMLTSYLIDEIKEINYIERKKQNEKEKERRKKNKIPKEVENAI